MLFLAVALAILSAAVAAPVAVALVSRPPAGLLRPNYRGAPVPLAGGLVLLAGLLAGEVGLAIAYVAGGGGHAAAVFLSRDHGGLAVVALGFFAVGLVDDLAGGGRARGFRGHLRALASGELTAGAVKAFGGMAIAFVVGALWEHAVARTLLDAGVIALSANFVNLLDVRPGRATKVFAAGWVALAAAAWGSAWVMLSLPVAVAAVIWFGPDLRERAMLGDAGANALGAVLGGGVALTLAVRGRLIVLILLVAVTVASERWSFSAAIDAVSPLRWLDRLGRRPEPAPPGR
jgi:UDP-GlcNAc:undecaprenyl-phosphate GlcNAc-1-phosphate transferase